MTTQIEKMLEDMRQDGRHIRETIRESMRILNSIDFAPQVSKRVVVTLPNLPGQTQSSDLRDAKGKVKLPRSALRVIKAALKDPDPLVYRDRRKAYYRIKVVGKYPVSRVIRMESDLVREFPEFKIGVERVIPTGADRFMYARPSFLAITFSIKED